MYSRISPFDCTFHWKSNLQSQTLNIIRFQSNLSNSSYWLAWNRSCILRANDRNSESIKTKANKKWKIRPFFTTWQWSQNFKQLLLQIVSPLDILNILTEKNKKNKSRNKHVFYMFVLILTIFSCQGRKPVFNQDISILRQSKDVWSEKDQLWLLKLLYEDCFVHIAAMKRKDPLSVSQNEAKIIYSNEFLLLGLC